MSAPDHRPHRSRRFLLLRKGRPHMSQSFGVYGSLNMQAAWVPPNRRWPMILNALVEKLKRRAKADFKGRHFEAPLILQAVSWYLRYPLSYRDIEELFLERGLAVDHSALDRLPHRNPILGRPSTSEEQAYLDKGDFVHTRPLPHGG